ncbi:hypothetical protein PIB30_086366 [Stylosanthes scabra]|uniref:Uncharacterized protein n=1 Tax=Stylosanthes scabra TaxID=79078 RepID=A0ABU6ZRR9_9FABA|nr:hypothetical protein [Stylosanthes scabra]
MFRNTCVSTLRELKQLILSHLGAEGGREIGGLAYRFQAITADNWLEYRPSWISKDNHWILSLCSYVAPLEPASINVVPPDYNSGEDSNYEEDSSCDTRDQEELVPNTPTARGPRLVLLAPLPIPALADVSSFLQQLDLDTRHVEDPTMESIAVEYNTDGGVEFMVGHKM